MTDAPVRLAAALADRYRIERELGQGGMATVYLAHDIKHDRHVALKVLKPELAAVLGAERFIVEIKTTAALQHPHILPLFDSGEADGFLFYVMPFIDGETLRAKLDRETQLGVDEAVRIASDVAEALQYAHEHGVIHRDIKPENILLANGRPMVADFGIALAVSAAAGGRMTETGLSLGTPHYMSPEQATAEKEITARSDIYSLASVLYEMLSGNPPHTGASAQQIIMKIIAEAPSAVTQYRKSVPPNVAAALAKALEKVPADRFARAKEFASALSNPHFTTASTAAMAGTSSGSVSSWLHSPFSKGAMALLVLFAVVTTVLATRDTAPNVSESVMAVALNDSMSSSEVFALADDGTIVFARGGQLFVRRAGEVTETALPGVQNVGVSVPGGAAPVLSPSGDDVVYTAVTGSATVRRSVLLRTSLRGGVPAPLWTVPDASTLIPLDWSEDGWIYFTLLTAGSSTQLIRVREAGGKIEPLADAEFREAVLLPGGKAIVGCEFRGSSNDVVAINLETRTVVPVASNACSPRWSPTGHLLIAHVDGTLNAYPFDANRLVVTGPTTPVLSSLAVLNGRARYQLSRTGTLLYVEGNATGAGVGMLMSLHDVDGTTTPIQLAPTDHPDAGFSPDGRMLAYTREYQIWVYDLDRGDHRKLTTIGSSHHNPVWSPDSKQVLFGAIRAGDDNQSLYVQAISGDSIGRRIGGTTRSSAPLQWLPDGTILLNSGQPPDIYRANAEQPGAQVPILQADWAEQDGRVSPNGKWLSYLSNEVGRNQLTVRSWPGLGQKSVIADSVQSGHQFWSGDNQTLYYMKGGRMMAASLQGADSLYAESHRVVIDAVNGVVAAAHPDGRRFLIFQQVAPPSTAGQAASSSLIVVTGWLSVLRQRLADGIEQ